MSEAPAFLFGPPPRFTEEEQARIDAYVQAEKDFNLSQRQVTVTWAMIWCDCRKWPDRNDPHPPQAGCTVHCGFMLTEDGRVL